MTYLAIFGRAVVAGQTKTRLIPELGAEGAAELYRCFLADAVEKLSGETESVELWVASNVDHPSLATIPLQVREQVAGDLGEKMTAAIAHGLKQDDSALVIGTDSPTLPIELLHQAERKLRSVDVVFGPSSDGGYYLVGARQELDFKGVPWSTHETLRRSIARVRDQGLTVGQLPPWYDIDEPGDLRLLRAHLALDPNAAPNTSRHFARSSDSSQDPAVSASSAR